MTKILQAESTLKMLENSNPPDDWQTLLEQAQNEVSRLKETIEQIPD